MDGLPEHAKGLVIVVVGVLVLESEREHLFTQRHVDTLQVLSSQLAAAIENARLYQQSVHDSEIGRAHV